MSRPGRRKSSWCTELPLPSMDTPGAGVVRRRRFCRLAGRGGLWGQACKLSMARDVAREANRSEKPAASAMA
jgi:hypothetical protein